MMTARSFPFQINAFVLNTNQSEAQQQSKCTLTRVFRKKDASSSCVSNRLAQRSST